MKHKKVWKSISKTHYMFLAALLILASLLMISLGTLFKSDTVARDLVQVIGTALFSVAVVDVMHEFTVEKKIRDQFQILEDLRDKGLERVCTPEEINLMGSEELKHTKIFKVIGMGNSWLLDEPNFTRLTEMLGKKNKVTVLIPNPLRPQIRARYEKDEPRSHRLELPDLAQCVLTWYELSQKYPTLDLKLYDRYPVSNISIYDKYIFSCPVLFQRQAKNNYTSVYRTDSAGGRIFEDHFEKMYSMGSEKITEDLIADLTKFVQSGNWSNTPIKA